MIPRTTIGVYLIRNVLDGTVYVGSSACSIKARWTTHRGMLRRGTHSNSHLQRAWDRDGADAFVFEAIEYVNDPAQTLAREQYWLDHYLQVGACYNFLPTAGSNKGCRRPQSAIDAMAKTYPGFCSPDGTEYRNVHNLARFCREHGLNKSSMEKLGRGQTRRTDEGWSRIDDDGAAGYSFRDRDGIIHDRIFDLKAFCLQHRLDYRSMRYVAAGERGQYHGWTRIDADMSLFLPNGGRKRSIRGIIFAFVDPNGVLYEKINNLSHFAEIHGLSIRNLHAVHKGKRKTCQGWRKA